MTRQSSPAVPRLLPPGVRAPIRTYAAVIGEVVWASNYSLGAFEILFSHVASHDDYGVGRAIWHTLPSDSSQLQVLRAATTASTRLSERMRERILWAIERALKLGELRNDAVHSATVAIMKNGKVTMAPSDIGTKPSRSEKLRREDDLKKKFRVVKGDLLQLGNYVHSLWPQVAGFSHPPLARKPQLQSLPKQIRRKVASAL